MIYIPIYGNMSPTGSDSEPGEKVRSGHDTQRQDRRGTDGGELQGEPLQLITTSLHGVTVLKCLVHILKILLIVSNALTCN